MADEPARPVLTSFKTKTGRPVHFAFPGEDELGNPFWNPVVAPGQPMAEPKPKIYTPYDYPFTNQLVALKDDAKMGEITTWIEDHYGKGIGKDIHQLSPAEAMELSRKILGERTEYDTSPPLEHMQKSVGTIADTLARKRTISFDEIGRLVLENRPVNDTKEVLHLLQDPSDQDVICRNQSESIVVLFEAIKKLQTPQTSRLNTSAVQIFGNTIGKDPLFGHPVGTLDAKTLVLENDKGEMVAIRTDRPMGPQQKAGEHDLGEGKIWILSPEEREKIIYTNDERPFLKNFPLEHVLVQFITLDKDGTYHVKVVNSSDESDKADMTGTMFMQEALLAWKEDASWKELREAHHTMWNKATEHSYLWHDNRQNVPLLMLHEAKEEKRKLTGKEKEWCETTLAEVAGTLSADAKLPAHAQDAELTLNICKLCTQTGEYAMAEKALAVAKEKGWEALPMGDTLADTFKARLKLADQVLTLRRQEAAAPPPPVPKIGNLPKEIQEAIAAGVLTTSSAFPFSLMTGEEAAAPSLRNAPRKAPAPGKTSAMKP